MGMFHIHGKDNLDISNVTSRITSEHFHGTSMSVLMIQFPTQGKKLIQVY